MNNQEKAREIELNVYAFEEKPKGEFQAPAYRAALKMAEWKDKNPSDETIMRILNCIGYEEESWIEFVRKRLENIS